MFIMVDPFPVAPDLGSTSRCSHIRKGHLWRLVLHGKTQTKRTKTVSRKLAICLEVKKMAGIYF